MLNNIKNNDINYTTTESNRQDRERSKREDSEYKYCYELYDYDQESIQACNTRISVVFCKKEAQSWVDHGINRTWHEKKVCKVFPEMRCSEHCGNTVREAQ